MRLGMFGAEGLPTDPEQKVTALHHRLSQWAAGPLSTLRSHFS
tara:strand:- start:440 stop:568 length:129 start_codon:yes stop_codon:yes gene_type:complete